MAQPFFNHEHFVQEEEELVEPVELDKNEQPSTPLIELKSLPSGLRCVFLHNKPKTPVIISDKLSDYETQQLVTVLERHRSTFGYSLEDLTGISPILYTHHIPIDPNFTPSREPQRRLNNSCKRLLRKRSSNSIMLGLFILCHIVSGLALCK